MLATALAVAACTSALALDTCTLPLGHGHRSGVEPRNAAIMPRRAMRRAMRRCIATAMPPRGYKVQQLCYGAAAMERCGYGELCRGASLGERFRARL